MTIPFIIAEVGCNHRGDLATAKDMIRVASRICGADVVKFQKRYPSESLTPAQYAAPHPVPENAYGATYGEHREALELTSAQHRELKQCCDEWGVQYSASVWDMTSAQAILNLQPSMIKVPSPCNTHVEMLSYLCDAHGGEIHISLGMTTRQEEEQIVQLVQRHGRSQDVVLYACVSGYPVAFDDVCLLEVERLKADYGHEVKGIGFSGHHLGISVDIAAMTLGAEWIERHFTLDRTWKGTDHAASLEPDGLRRLVRDIRNVSKALQRKSTDLLPVEVPQREKLKWKGHHPRG